MLRERVRGTDITVEADLDEGLVYVYPAGESGPRLRLDEDQAAAFCAAVGAAHALISHKLRDA